MKKALSGLAALLLGASSVALGVCGPFTDVAADGFCPFVLEIFTLGITTGTSPTTYDPASSVSRLQMAAFLSRSVDGVLKRGSRRAPLRQFWTSQNARVLQTTPVSVGPRLCKSDGRDVWVSVPFASPDGGVFRLRGTDGKVLDTWTGATGARGILVAMGRVFAAGAVFGAPSSPGKLYRVDPTQPAGTVTTLSTALGAQPNGMAYDGTRIWIANLGDNPFAPGSVSIATPGATTPWTVTNITTGFSAPMAVLYDGSSIWVVDAGAGTLLKLDAAGAILQTVTVGGAPGFPVFDGTNIWVPNQAGLDLTVVRASTGAVVKVLTGNGMEFSPTAAFDGQRVLVSNFTADSVSLWKAADLTPLGSFSLSTSTNVNFRPYGTCSDGTNFWITEFAANQVLKF